ncbi:DUF2399 domain-containing protein [Streptomyces sp. NPDC060311]|uniref:DUF2399 domain-containing protein n=1 Tax=Streptomyces sp. NPDC060311 TaxID=3347096 RepID=UPI0036514ADA
MDVWSADPFRRVPLQSSTIANGHRGFRVARSQAQGIHQLPLGGQPVSGDWHPDLAPAMTALGVALHEEAILDLLVDDLVTGACLTIPDCPAASGTHAPPRSNTLARGHPHRRCQTVAPPPGVTRLRHSFWAPQLLSDTHRFMTAAPLARAEPGCTRLGCCHISLGLRHHQWLAQLSSHDCRVGGDRGVDDAWPKWPSSPGPRARQGSLRHSPRGRCGRRGPQDVRRLCCASHLPAPRRRRRRDDPLPRAS